MNPNAREALDGHTLTILQIGAALALTRHPATRRVDLAVPLMPPAPRRTEPQPAKPRPQPIDRPF